ncbi:MAG: hypothetical protein COB84_08915 [Rhodobacteraceae bacterium]|nr:MAG: hypothetical protein COB84_08915 [Paracoccaceae bacterium]
MTISAAIVMFAVIWFMMLLMILPTRMTSQGEAGEVVRGTSASAPVDPKLRQKVKWVTLLTIPVWVIVCGTIISGIIDLDMLYSLYGLEN